MPVKNSKNIKIKKKLREPNVYERLTEHLSVDETAKLNEFFRDLSAHIALSQSDSRRLKADFEKALLYFIRSGVSLDEALRRLDVENLGGFYSRPPVAWYSLDDAAKIYPLSMKHGQMAVFRLSVYLKERVVEELLQMALTFTIKRFPSFATTVKKGFFWHYLDSSKRRYSIELEDDIPCRPLPISRSGSQPFRVLYYGNRISVEYFHILTDGMGGMVFLKTLTAEYLRLLGIDYSVSHGVLSVKETPLEGEDANEFPRDADAEKASGFVNKAALQMSGRLSFVKPCRVLHFKMDAAKLKQVAQSKNTTVTAYILALLFVAGKRATDETQGEFSIQVPINMRKYYPSNTLRNFSLYCMIRLACTEVTDADSILPRISQELAEKASLESMREMMRATVRLVNAVRYVPIFIKAPIVKLVYGFLGDKILSNTLSNIGVVTMPPELTPYIESMDFVLGTALTNRASCAMATFGNTATLSISKNTADPSFEDALYKLLEADGLIPVVEGSELYES